MSKLVLIRHGEPDYSHVTQRNFKGHGMDLAQLTPLGIQQAKEASLDSRLDGADLIISSPYTRTMQTAAIISKARGLDIEIELDLHEWIPDLTFNNASDTEVAIAAKECTKHKGEYDDNDPQSWERLSTVAERAFAAVKKHLHHDKIIIVTHGVLMRQFKFEKHIPYCGILEVDFDENFKWDGWIEE